MTTETDTKLTIHLWDQDLSPNEAIKKLNHSKPAQRFIAYEIAKRILLEKACHEQDIPELTAEEQDTMMENFRKANNIASDEAYQAFLEQTKNTDEWMREKLAYQERLLSLRDKLITADKIREYFMQARFSREQITFSVIRVKEKDLAETISKQINTEFADFAEIARTHSLEPNAQNGGLVGTMPVTNINPALAQLLVNMRPGEVTQPIPHEEDDSYVIAQLNNYHRATLNQQVAEAIRNELFESWIEENLALAEPSIESN